ncbi:MAG TPA: lytic transglycosylase domain-containing protein [Gemmatirosa sp.]
MPRRLRTARLIAAAFAVPLALVSAAPGAAQQPSVAPPSLSGAAASPIPGPSLGDSAITIPIPTVAAGFGGSTTAPFAHTPGLTWDLDVLPFEGQERVQRYVSLFSTSARDRFTEWLRRGSRYDALIRGKLRAGGLPEDLTYLALVESGYDVHATSRVRAVGMWQFMAETARDVGLRVDWWVDERRDPVRSTDAAVRTLRWLKTQFGSYFVAAAAYNGGSGRVARGLAQLASVDSAGAIPAGDARFFALADHDVLHDETKNYVPQLIAAALVAKEAPRYAIRPSELPPLAYDSVRVPGLTPLAAVAAASHASRADLLDLNPHLLRGVTPPGAALLVRVPAGQGAAAAERFASLGDEIRRAFHAAVTRKRDTWATLAERVGIPRTWLERYNAGLATVAHGRNRGHLASGQTVRVPTEAVLAYARDVPSDGEGPGALPRLAPVADGAAADDRAADRFAATSDAHRPVRAPTTLTPAARGQHVARAKAQVAVARLHRRRAGQA